jgi:hypothetical protein
LSSALQRPGGLLLSRNREPAFRSGRNRTSDTTRRLNRRRDLLDERRVPEMMVRDRVLADEVATNPE